MLTVSATGLAAQTVTVHALDAAAASAFSVGPVVHEAGPGFGFTRVHLQGEPGQTYAFEASTNLQSPWTPLATNTLLSSATNLLDTAATNLPMRFYRGRLVP
jgi:hypothetical protein